MRLTPEQIEAYDRDGYVVLPDLIRPVEVELLRTEVTRLAAIECPAIKRERNGLARSILRAHETDGDTASPAFHALSRLPRLLGPATDLLRDASVYIYHSKINVKQALYGGIYAWHQDYGTWERDGTPDANIVTALVMLDDAEEIGGALYFVPGSHRWGGKTHLEDPESDALNPLSVERRALLDVLRAHKPVPVLGRAGTVVLFHSQLVHGSGHNMSPRDRRQAYIVYNPVANRPRPVARPRPDFVCSRNTAPISAVADTALIPFAE